MKKMKKFMALALSFALIAGALTACGGGGSDSVAEESTAEESSAEESTAEEGSTEDSTEEEDSTEPEGGGEVLTFGTNAEFPPYEFVAANGVIGEYDGIDMAIAKQIAEDHGMTPEIENMEFDSLLLAIENEQVDAIIAGMTVTEERKEAVDFSTPYYTATQVMIVREDSDIQKATDMADKKIVVIQGYTGETCVQDMGYEYEAFKKGTEAIMELKNEKCDVVVIDSVTAQKYVDDNEGLKIVEDSSAFDSEEYAIAVKKGNTELLDKINTSIEKMLDDGTISELGAKYTEATE